jgi:glycosyltransferase involved in cell wall biosynthesis
VLQVHNAYCQPGGEDQVVAVERELLESHGHEVRLFGADNDEIGGLWSRLATAWRAPYSPDVRRRLAGVLEEWRPEVVHVHNFFPLLTPAIFDACRAAGVPSAMTLHNFRLICPGAFLQRDGIICEDCLGDTSYRAVLHRCYRGSFFGSLAVTRMVEYHRRRRTWREKVDRFIVMTEFARQKFAAAALEAERIRVKPHFCPDPVALTEAEGRRGALFAGRLSPEKGVTTLLEAWSGLAHPLYLAGEGPLRIAVERSGNPQVHILGWLSSAEMSVQLRQARCLVIPSEWYETFGLVIIEAFAHGLPVVASRLGAMAELVVDGVTGLHFEAGNPDDLATKVEWLLEHPEECRRMGVNARRTYEEKYTPERNYQLLMNIYREVIDEKKKDHQHRH